MHEHEDLPDAVQKAHRTLQPYIKQRQETARIRRILAAHLSSDVTEGKHPITHPLSLLEPTSEVESTSNGVRGLQREYARCLRENNNTRRVFSQTSKQHQPQPKHKRHPSTRAIRDDSEVHDESRPAFAAFLDTVEYRRKHERLRIMQEYLDMAVQKSLATVHHNDPKVALKDMDSPPEVPPEVMGTAESRQDLEGTDPKELVGQLEKAVLRANLLLKKEQKFLAKIKNHSPEAKGGSTDNAARLRALGMTRNELISWIERELARAAEGSPDSNSAEHFTYPEKGFIEGELVSIQKQYNQYSKARRTLILAATGILDEPRHTESANDGDEIKGNEADASSNMLSHIMHPYLVELMSVSNEQKSMIQQKSHLTVSLAKHLKEAGQDLDRLVEESHLLPAYPMPSITSHGNNLARPASFSDGVSSHEKPESSRRARAWVFAADSAAQATKDDISNKVDEGFMDVLDAQQTLLKLHGLLGGGSDTVHEANDQTAKDVEVAKSGDAWAALDGNLGAIKMGASDFT